MKLALFALFALVCSISQAKAAPPGVGDDCGFGGTATIVGSKEAGKVTLGADHPTDGRTGCTLVFSWPGGKVPSCSAIFEAPFFAPLGAQWAPDPVGVVTTATTLWIPNETFTTTMKPGFVISYLCVGQ